MHTLERSPEREREKRAWEKEQKEQRARLMAASPEQREAWKKDLGCNDDLLDSVLSCRNVYERNMWAAFTKAHKLAREEKARETSPTMWFYALAIAEGEK